MRDVTFEVDDFPPAKSEAKSMLAQGHGHERRVVALLEAARSVSDDVSTPLFGSAPIGMEVLLTSPSPPPSDATNYLGGIGDVLEAKGHRGGLDHLGDLAGVALYENDRQIQEVHFRWEAGARVGYVVRLWLR